MPAVSHSNSAQTVLRKTLARRSGFTLVELLLVVMVLGVVAGVAAPKYRAAMDGIALETAAKRLAADLRYARQEAMRRAVEIGLDFDAAAETYRSTTIGGATLPDLDHPSQTLAVDLWDYNGRVALASTSFASDRVTFDFRGDPSGAGSVELTNGSDTALVSVTLAGEVYLGP